MVNMITFCMKFVSYALWAVRFNQMAFGYIKIGNQIETNKIFNQQTNQLYNPSSLFPVGSWRDANDERQNILKLGIFGRILLLLCIIIITLTKPE